MAPGSNPKEIELQTGDKVAAILKTKKYTGQCYHNYISDKATIDAQIQHSRFIPFSKRPEICAIQPEAFEPLSEGKYQTEWKGISMIKCCMDMVAYQQLIWEIKPKIIIEFGTAYGGSALWMSDLVKSYDLDTHIYTLDIDTKLCDPKAKVATNVTFVQGDSNKIEEAFPTNFLKDLPHPWLVIEDAHINVVGIMDYMHNYLKRGDYLIIEDTNPLGPAKLIQGYTAPGFKGVGQAKLDQVKEFMQNHDEEYMVDAKVQDMFGLNGSWNMNSTFLKL